MSVPDPPELYSRLPENAVRILSMEKMPEQPYNSFWKQPELCCHLEIAVLEFPLIPDYDALSYVWGDPTERVPILCNGCSMTIGRNLFSALSQIWALEPEQRLWADAICINQADLEEKSTQVAMMARIYASAIQVRVWLGPEVRLSQLLWERIQACGTPERLKAEVDRDFALQTAFYHLGCRSWFYRIWTYQEIVLALKAVVQCGNLRLDWTTFNHVSKRLLLSEEASRKDPVSLLEQSKRNQNPGFAAVFNLQQELTKTSDRDATDRRDKIYGLLGLPSLKLFRHIRPDYSLSIVDAYTQAARNLIDAAQNLSIFLMAGIANRKGALRDAMSSPGRGFGVVDQEHPVWKTPSSGLGNRLMANTSPEDKKWLTEWEMIASNLPSWVPNWNASLHSTDMFGVWQRSLEGPIRQNPTGSILGPGSRRSKIELRGRVIGLLRVEWFPRANPAGSHHIEAFSDCIRDSVTTPPHGVLLDPTPLCQAIKEHEEQRCGCLNLKPRSLSLSLSSSFYVQTKMASDTGDWVCALDGLSELCLLRLASQLSYSEKGFEYSRTPEFELVSPLIMNDPDLIRQLPRDLPGFEVSFVLR